MRVVTKNAKLESNISKDGRHIYVEIYKPIGEVEKDGKKLPLFYRDGQKDSMTAKFNKAEWETMRRGLEIYLSKGIDAFKAYAKSVTGNEKFDNLVFPHNNRTAGLKAFKGKNGEYIGFIIKEGDNAYQLLVNDKLTLNYMASAMKGILDAANLMEYVPALRQQQKMGVTNENEADIGIEEEEPPFEMEEEPQTSAPSL